MSCKEPWVKYLSFYPSYREAIDILPNDEQKLAAYEIITDFGLYGIEPNLEIIPYNLQLLFTAIKANIESSVKNVQNGSKGGRPKKEELQEDKKGVKTPVKTPVNTKKEKDKEKEMENIPFTYSYKEDTLPPPADAGGASLFTLTDCQQCAKEGKVNLSEDGIKAFYNRMMKDGWTIKGKPVTNLLLAMRGFAKNHKQYQNQPDVPEKKVTKPESDSLRRKTAQDYMRELGMIGEEEEN